VSHREPGHGATSHTQLRLSGRQPWPGHTRHSTADSNLDDHASGDRSASARPARPQGHDERSTTFAHRSPPPEHAPARRRVPATRAAARPRRSHRRCHRGTAAPIHHCPRARRRAVHCVQDPPRLPLPALRRRVPGRHLPAHPRGAQWRQGSTRHRRHPPVRLHHPNRAFVRLGPRSPREGQSSPTVPSS
jgi:hypothetical protein